MSFEAVSAAERLAEFLAKNKAQLLQSLEDSSLAGSDKHLLEDPAVRAIVAEMADTIIGEGHAIGLNYIYHISSEHWWTSAGQDMLLLGTLGYLVGFIKGVASQHDHEVVNEELLASFMEEVMEVWSTVEMVTYDGVLVAIMDKQEVPEGEVAIDVIEELLSLGNPFANEEEE